MTQGLKVTQLFDCADVGQTFVAEGRKQGKPWRLIQGPWTRGGTKAAYYRFRVEQLAAYPRTQLWHVNMGGRAKWARGALARPYVLTLHGTDIRESYWQSEHHETIKEDIDGARGVWFTTPDLTEKAQSVRADAEYLPAPVDVAQLPSWQLAEHSRVFFPSRWDASKGGDSLVQLAAEVVRATKHLKDIEIVGLDWGDRASEEAAVGVKLLPRMSKSNFLRELSTSHVAVGQTAGILAVSELQAIGIGIPTVFSDQVAGYPEELGTVSVPVKDAPQAVLEALADPLQLSAHLNGPGYIKSHHAPAVLLPRLEAGYRKALEASQ